MQPKALQLWTTSSMSGRQNSVSSSHRECWGLRSSVTLSRPCLHWPSWSSSYRELKSSVTLSCPCSHWPSCCSSHRARRELKSSVTLFCPWSHWPSCCSSHSAHIIKLSVTLSRITTIHPTVPTERVKELWESRGGRPGLSFLTSLMVSVDVMQHWTILTHWSQLVPNMSTDIRGH